MQTIPASELKRRGVSVLEEYLPFGPVHIVKRNHLTCVVLSEDEYEKLLKVQQPIKQLSLAHLLNKPSTGTKTRPQLDKLIKQERESWGDK